MTQISMEYAPIESLMPYQNNARKHGDQDTDAIVRSIEEFGFNDPIGVWKNIIVEGHGRLIAAKRLGMTEVPIIRLDHMTDEQRKAYALAHNKTAELSEWDFDVLASELADIAEIDMTAFGFDDAAAEDAEDVQEDEFDPEVPEEPTVEFGQIWILGNHRLMCGDSADPEDMNKLFGGVEPKMVFTDPPYGVAIGSKNKAINAVDPGRGERIEVDIEGDTLTTEELRDVLLSAFRNLREHCAEDCAYYVSSPQGGDIGLMMMMMMRDAGLEVRHNLIWVKNSPTFSMGRLDYDYKHEPIFYTWTKKHNFYGGYNNTVIDDSMPIDKMSKAELKELVRALQQENTSVVYADKPMHSDLHPTMKPVKLVGRFIVNSSQKGDPVADVFGGSGTTMIACEQLGRKCYMMEKDPHYADVIINRWEQFTGQKAKLLDGKAQMEVEN